MPDDLESIYAKILRADDHGTIWILRYQIEGNGDGSVYFDQRSFGHFYEGATQRSFFEDYSFGAGREDISNRLKDIKIQVEGEFPEPTVRLLDELYEE